MKDINAKETTPDQKLYEKAPKENAYFWLILSSRDFTCFRFWAAVTTILVRMTSNFDSLPK